MKSVFINKDTTTTALITTPVKLKGGVMVEVKIQGTREDYEFRDAQGKDLTEFEKEIHNEARDSNENGKLLKYQSTMF